MLILFLPNIPWWLAVTIPALAVVAWLDLRTLAMRPIVQFWWILLVLIAYIPGWLVLKVYVTYRRRAEREAT